MNKRYKGIVTVSIIILLLAIIFYPKLKPVFASKPGGDQATAGRPVQTGRQPLNVNGFYIEPTLLSDMIQIPGTLRPDEEVDLTFEASGKIIDIAFTEGSRVKKGDLLAKINDKPLQAQLEKLVAQKKLSEAMEFRQRSLLDRDAISQESYDQIQTELQTIQADINLVKARIAETELRAPFDGMIGLRYVSEGSYTNSSTKIARLIKIKPIKLEFSVPERYADKVRIGYPVTFVVEGYDLTFNASVYAVDPKIDLDTRTIVLRAIYPNNKEELRPGRSAKVTLLLSQLKNSIAIPSEALVPQMEGEFVYVYRAGKAESLKVETGLRTESMIQITSGLNFGDTLLTSGILQLRQSLPVVLDTVMRSGNKVNTEL